MNTVLTIKWNEVLKEYPLAPYILYLDRGAQYRPNDPYYIGFDLRYIEPIKYPSIEAKDIKRSFKN